ncbi:uncharacterized protein LOC116002347 [Ipomoea triloba]|uniref:uncharacterized protein LOC116002347 n=1 Tax=Ipomoea triloba TaxID=35885 RepID=UPI00125DF46F|nr:uncharacterized protein LOC116002347 [Ipomoea triloba]
MKSVSSTVENNITFLEDELIWQPSTLGSFTFDTVQQSLVEEVPCILRNSEGLFIVALSFPLTASCALEAEALALAFAMRWCDLAARKPTLIQVDSSVLVHIILNHEAPIPWKIRQSIFTIRHLLSSWSSSIAHSYRETNKVADSLASFGCNLLSPSVFFTPISLPPSVISSLLYDWRGLLTPRLSS